MNKSFIALICWVVVFNANAAPKKITPASIIQSEITNADGMTNAEIISTLRQDIQTIDANITECEKQRKLWTAATVVGGVGIIGTGIVAINRANKLSDKKSEYNEIKSQINVATSAANTAEQELNKLSK